MLWWVTVFPFFQPAPVLLEQLGLDAHGDDDTLTKFSNTLLRQPSFFARPSSSVGPIQRAGRQPPRFDNQSPGVERRTTALMWPVSNCANPVLWSETKGSRTALDGAGKRSEERSLNLTTFRDSRSLPSAGLGPFSFGRNPIWAAYEHINLLQRGHRCRGKQGRGLQQRVECVADTGFTAIPRYIVHSGCHGSRRKATSAPISVTVPVFRFNDPWLMSFFQGVPVGSDARWQAVGVGNETWLREM